MKRRTTRAVAVVSLLLLAAVAGAWVRSHLPEQFHVLSHRGRLHLVFAAARWRMFHEEAFLPAHEVLQEINAYTAGEPGSVQWRFARFELLLSDRRTGFWVLAVPYWALALPPAAAALWAVRAERTRRRRKRGGKCLRCGYDLRATPGACPECGAPATTWT